MTQHYDVAIIGGGPAGSTAAALLKKYDPEISVLILEREKFPRDHVGESQLPPIGAILHEMGCWEEVESAGFPIKIGVTYRWGKTEQLWDFDFVPADKFVDAPRPAPYAGQRLRTALQVDRAIYDEILLNHAEKLGAEVRQEVAVKKILSQDGRVEAFELSDSSSITADWFIDASGHSGIMRRALGIDVHYPGSLKNIAIWDYWENATWADEIGVGGTRVQVLSQPAGWIWFIPLGPTRTSIGLITPVEHYKSSGLSHEQLYRDALAGDERVSGLIEGATSREIIETTTDWSFLAEKTYGENWFLIGEAAGFADPILAAGMTLAHGSARECAYSILELRKKEHDAQWLKSTFDQNQRGRIRQHIRFADFWYASNGQFSDLQEHCRSIAEDAGLELTTEQAWQWISQGGFSSDVPGQAVVAGFVDLASAKRFTGMFTGGELDWSTDKKNVFKLDTEGAAIETIPTYRDGKITPVQCLIRNKKKLPLTGINQLLYGALQKSPYIDDVFKMIAATLEAQKVPAASRSTYFSYVIQALESMVAAGWVKASLDESRARLDVGSAANSKHIFYRNE
ncbi:MAG: NAD(P)/FAD-dependent oxidoreductase [Planctomycetota bacterium]